MQHAGVQHGAVAGPQAILPGRDLQQQRAADDVDDLQLVVPVPGDRVLRPVGDGLQISGAGKRQRAVGLQLPLRRIQIQSVLLSALLQGHGVPPHMVVFIIV